MTEAMQMSVDAVADDLISCPQCSVVNRVPTHARASKCGRCGQALERGHSSPPPSGAATVLADVAADTQHTRPASLHRAIEVEQIKTGNLGVAWILAAVVGAASISALRGVEVDAVRLILPCAIMLAYFAWGWNQRSRNNEKLADSLYFLGFIWTLYALIDALIASEATAPTADALYVTFGYALVTTGLGMFLRMVVIQLEYSIPDQLQDTRSTLAQGVDEFRARLDESISALTTTRNELMRSATVWTASANEVSRSMQESSRGVATQTQDSVRQVVKTLSEINDAVQASGASTKLAGRAVSSLARKVVTSSEKLNETMSKASDDTASALQETAEKLRRLDVPDNLLAQRLEELAREIAVPIRTTLSATRDMADAAVKTSEHIATQSDSTKIQVAALNEALGELRGTAGSINAALGEMQQRSVQWSTSAANLVDVQQKLLQAITELEMRLRSVQQSQPNNAERGVAPEPARIGWPWRR